MRGFAVGSTIVLRDVFEGSVWSASPGRVLADDGGNLTFGYWPGVEALTPTSWIDSLTTGDPRRRSDALADLAARRWELGRWTWRWTNVIHTMAPGRWFSVNSFFDAATGDRLLGTSTLSAPTRGPRSASTRSTFSSISSSSPI